MTGQHRGEPKRPDRCAWPGCRKRARPPYIMCRGFMRAGHWYRLPARIRSRILDTYPPRRSAPSPEYLEARLEALTFARQAEAADRGSGERDG